MSRISKVVVFLMLLTSQIFAGSDVPGSQDHPLISRYPGSSIKWYDVQNYDRYKIATGPVTGYRQIDEWLPAAGKVTRIYYSLSGSRSVTEVYYNYLKALKKSGFKIIAEGLHKSRNVSKKIGGRNWLGVYYKENSFPSSENIQLLQGSSTVGGSCFVAGKLTKRGASVYVAVTGTQYKDDTVLFMIDVIEEEAVEDDLIFVNADAMSKAIDMYGKVALYGIYFDFDKATLKPASKPTLDEIAALLKSRPKLKLYVVGHTDMKGRFAYNRKLSTDRAHSVVTALTKTYRIAANRLQAHGVGFLAPVASNRNNAGRAKNRRVELVAQ
ncbi:MAG: OmpA family protein [bacterium]